MQAARESRLRKREDRIFRHEFLDERPKTAIIYGLAAPMMPRGAYVPAHASHADY